jgi:hypothetical protein
MLGHKNATTSGISVNQRLGRALHLMVHFQVLGSLRSLDAAGGK